MNLYLLRNDDGMWLVFGEDVLQAANALLIALDRAEGDVNTFSVSGSWPVDPSKPIDLGRLWPHFTSCPGKIHLSDLLRKVDR